MSGVTRDSEGRLRVPARTIPPPSTISPEARNMLAGSSLFSMESMGEPPASDLEAWRRLSVESEARFAEMLAPMEKLFPARVESHEIGTATLFEITPPSIPADREARALFYVHGGAFWMGGGRNAVRMALGSASAHRCKTFSIDYRMPPDHPFPAGLEDAVEAYRWLIERYEPANIAVTGGSAGGGLAASTLLKVRDLGLPLPAAAILVTPESDLTESGDSFETNHGIDTVLLQRLTESIKLYANGHDLRDPYLSPVFADFSKGFPPSLLIAGTRDLFLSNTVLLHRALRRAGCEADLVVFEAMPHGGFFGAPEDAESMAEQVRFADAHVGRGSDS